MIWLFLAIVGPDVRVSSDPTVVRVEVVTDAGTGLCSGVVIGAHRVLTAAHCVALSAVGPVRVNGVSHVDVDPAFDPQALHLGHDLAVLTTDQTFETVARIAEPSSDVASVRIVGFGLRDDGSSGDRYEADVAVLSADDRFFELAANDDAPCLGDSGGAAFVGDDLVGIVSYSRGCSAFAKITRLSAYPTLPGDSRGCQASPSGSWLLLLLALVQRHRVLHQRLER